MAAYSFKKQFIPYILDGSKTHTIRGKRKHPDKPGATFYGYYGMRTKQCRKLIEAPVLRLEDIRMERARIWIDSEELDRAEKNTLAWRDGFREGLFDQMLSFWIANHGTTDFHGDLIHWDYSKRVMLAESVYV
jgi:hypothetical protein